MCQPGYEGGPAPPGIADLGPEVWRGSRPPQQRGFVALGTPIGTPEYVRAWGAERLEAEDTLLRQLPKLPDLQCAWLLLSFCAAPRANHALRTVPPDLLAPYTAACDAAVWGTLQACLGATAEDEACPARARLALAGWDYRRPRAPAPRPIGRPGCPQCAARTCPAFSDWAVPCLTDARGPACLRTASEARRLLVVEGWTDVPSWELVEQGARPPDRPDGIAEPGEWRHGWQHCASRTRNLFFRDHVLLPSLPPSHRALLRSQAGPHAAAWLQAIPSDPHTSLTPETMQIALRCRLRLQLPLAPGRCGSAAEPGCGRRAYAFGDHALACPRTGLLARRAKLVERAWCKVAREGVGPEGHVVPQQWLVNTTAPGIAPDDRRRLDLVIYGAAPLSGALCCDATLVSPLARDGEPHPGAAAQDGAVLRTAYRRKHATYPELATGGAQTLYVLGCEVGGRWNADAVKLVQRLVALRAHRAPPAVRASAKAAWARRWWSVLSVAVQQAVAHAALGRARAMPGPAHIDAPALDEVLHLADPDGPSRLPLR